MSESAVQDETLIFGDIREVARRLGVSTKTVLRSANRVACPSQPDSAPDACGIYRR